MKREIQCIKRRWKGKRGKLLSFTKLKEIDVDRFQGGNISALCHYKQIQQLQFYTIGSILFFFREIRPKIMIWNYNILILRLQNNNFN